MSQERVKIGQSHADARASFGHALRELRDGAEGSFAAAFDAQYADFEQWTAGIAAIGQVKAGKSSLLNSLIGQVGFLPSDVNPWTSVVTNMRMNVPGDPASGARFEFFDEASWDRIVNGDPRVRKAAQKFLPGFDPEILREQTEEMRRIAKRRLGDSFEKLLGSKHDYDLLSAELLESYVCAGPTEIAEESKTAVGRYSSITKVANLFMRNNDYAVPTIITDTPGVNDPFLVRDEFTCQSLDQSDIFLVILSAHQALTPVDIALIRMLSLQDGKDVIIFINRVDELEDMSNRVERVAADVRARVEKAIPGHRFTIRFGSAYWAELALRDDISDSKLRSFTEDAEFRTFLQRHRSEHPEDPREALLEASGIGEIKATLSKAISDGVGARFLDRIAGGTHSQLAAMRSVLNRRRHELKDRIEMFGSGRGAAEFKETLTDEMTGLAETHTALLELLDDLNEKLDSAISSDWVKLQKRMDRQIEKFVSDQRDYIEELWTAEQAPSEAAVDLLPLRDSLEDVYHRSYASVRKSLDTTLSETLAEAEKLATKAFGAKIGITMDGLPHTTVAATFSTAKKTLGFNLSSKRSWKFWKARKVDVDKSIEGLKRVTAAEVFPATNRMVVAFTSAITERALAGKERLELLTNTIEQSLNERIVRLREDFRIVEQTQDSDARTKLLNRLHNDIEVIENRLQLVGSHEGVFVEADAKAA